MLSGAGKVGREDKKGKEAPLDIQARGRLPEVDTLSLRVLAHWPEEEADIPPFVVERDDHEGLTVRHGLVENDRRVHDVAALHRHGVEHLGDCLE